MAVIHPVILAGGSGTRLWPLSRKSYPKQFSPLFGAQSLLVLWLSRSGMGSEAATWALAALFIGTFTAVFIFGSRYIGRHRTR